MTVRDVIAKIVVPCLLPVGDEGKCTVATVDQFGPDLADRFIKSLHTAGYVIIKDRTDPEGGIPGRTG